MKTFVNSFYYYDFYFNSKLAIAKFHHLKSNQNNNGNKIYNFNNLHHFKFKLVIANNKFK